MPRPLIALCLGALACVAPEAHETPDVPGAGATVVVEAPKLGTTLRLVVHVEGADDEPSARAAIAEALARVDVLDRVLSNYGVSELTRLADHPPGAAVPVSAELFAVLALAAEVAARSDGAFDVTVGPLAHLWRRAIREGQLPAPARLAEARAAVGRELLVLDEEARSVTLGAPGMQLDLGGIAKGWIADELLGLLAARGFPAALVDAGGDLVCGAPPPGAEGWKVEVDLGGAAPVRLVLAHAAVATSGDRYRFVEVDGVRWSHLVDPRTGLGLRDAAPVAVVARDGATADALASAVSVLGLEAGARLVAGYAGARLVAAPGGAPQAIVAR